VRILFLSRWFPWPADNGSKLRAYSLLLGLARQHSVTLLSFADGPAANPEAPEVLALCSEAHVVPWKEFNPRSVQARLGFLNWKPRSVIDTFSAEMARNILRILRERNYDLVIASQLPMAAYHPYFRDVPALFEELELGWFHDRAFSADRNLHFRPAITWLKLRLYLSRLLGSFEACTVVSERERQLLLRNFPGYKNRIAVVPNCLNVDEYRIDPGARQANTLIFSGSFRYRANYEAMLWFVRDVLPLIAERIPDVKLIITGDHANLPLPPSRHVERTGHVDDAKSWIGSCSVSIAPLWSGGGTRFKILEAMALGTPVVATSKGAEGLDGRDREHLLLADTPRDFAECVVTLLHNEELRGRLVKNANLLVQSQYSWPAMHTRYLRLIDAVVSQS
jgi:glycosyltransferase involved in cell wall biosynthesis